MILRKSFYALAASSILLASPALAQEDNDAHAADAATEVGCAGAMLGDDERVAGRGGRDGPVEIAVTDKTETGVEEAFDVAGRGSGGGAAAFEVAGRGTSGDGAPSDAMLTAHNRTLSEPASVANFSAEDANPCTEGRGSSSP